MADSQLELGLKNNGFQDCKELMDATSSLKSLERASPEAQRALMRQYNGWQSLQLHVNVLIDSSLDKNTTQNNGACCLFLQ